jgi:integrase
MNMHEVMEHDGSKQFLNSIARNSKGSAATYSAALAHFATFLDARTEKYDLRSIIKPLISNEINVYELLDEFVAYLMERKNGNDKSMIISNSTITLYIRCVRSYLAYYDIDIIPAKFKRKVKVPKVPQESEEAIDATDIRNILLSCNNRRLKPYLLTLASGGMRADEACSIREIDIDFSFNPTKIHLRKEYTKTKVARDIYISDEATQYLKQWIDWRRKRIQDKTELVFSSRRGVETNGLYDKLRSEFIKILAAVGLDQKKDGMQRRKVTLHSFRRFVNETVTDQVNGDYANWLLGHKKNSYYTKKEQYRRQIYAEKCMKYLTFLNYEVLETTGRSIEAQLSVQQKENQILRVQMNALIASQTELSKKLYEAGILKKD